MPFLFPGTFLMLILFVLANSLRILREYERGVIFRLGRFISVRGPGLIILVPFIERMVKVSLRTLGSPVSASPMAEVRPATTLMTPAGIPAPAPYLSQSTVAAQNVPEVCSDGKENPSEPSGLSLPDRSFSPPVMP